MASLSAFERRTKVWGWRQQQKSLLLLLFLFPLFLWNCTLFYLICSVKVMSEMFAFICETSRKAVFFLFWYTLQQAFASFFKMCCHYLAHESPDTDVCGWLIHLTPFSQHHSSLHQRSWGGPIKLIPWTILLLPWVKIHKNLNCSLSFYIYF